MSSKTENKLELINVSKNKENDERRRPSIHFIDLSSTLVFTKDELEKEILKIPEQKLRPDDDMILMRTSNVRRAPSLINPDLMDTSSSLLGTSRSRGRKRPIYSASPRSLDGGSFHKQRSRKRSSVLSVASSTSDLINSINNNLRRKSNSSSELHRHSPEVSSFYELIQATNKLTIKDAKDDSFPYPDPIPTEMRFLNMKDLITTNIDWKMLTMVRPASKLDEEYFSRIVEMKRLEYQTKMEEGFINTSSLNRKIFKHSRHPKMMYKYRSHDMDFLDELNDLLPDIDYESYARDEDVEGMSMNNDGIENAAELVNKLLGDDFSENFIKAEDKERIERRKSSVKKVSKGTKTVKVKTEPSVVAKDSSKKKIYTKSSKVRVVAKEKKKKMLAKDVVKGKPKEEVAKDDEMEEKDEEEAKDNKFANVWIDATKEKEAPKIVVTGALPGE